jgi:hypothetical protein
LVAGSECLLGGERKEIGERRVAAVLPLA